MIGHIPLEKLKKKYEHPHSKYIDVDGNHIHYCDEGEGPVLVLLHGVLSSLHTWNGWVDVLKDHYRIIRFDVPGFGLTGPIMNGSYTPEYTAEFCEKICNALGIHEPFYLAGNSLGGFIAWNYAATYPHRVKKLILLDPIGYPQSLPFTLSLVVSPLIRKIARKVSPRFLVERNVKDVYGDHRKITKPMMDMYYHMLMREGNRETMVEVFDAFKEYSVHPTLKDRIKDIHIPTLLMWGRKDRWVPVQLVDNWMQDLPRGEHIIYEEAGHIPMEEIPELTARDAYFFMRREGDVCICPACS